MRWFLSLKSYGDCIIASNALRVHGRPSDFLLCGSHLRPLIKAIGYQGNIEWLEAGDVGVPAFFDLRKHGFLPALSSALILRRLINESVAVNDLLVFDSKGWRQIFLSGINPVAQIAIGLPNIYLDYEQFLSGVVSDEVECAIKKPISIGIFPDSRLVTKRLNDALVSNIFHRLIELNFHPKIVYVGGMPISKYLNIRVINGFEALIDSIHDFDAIISADSLPAHLAEYFNKPVFVFSPVNNNYWLPKSSFNNDRFALFDDFQKCTAWLISLGN